MSFKLAMIGTGILLGLAGIVLVGVLYWFGQVFKGWDWNEW